MKINTLTIDERKNLFDKIDKIQNKIDEELFIPEYITVVIDHPKHYEHIFNNGFKVNGRLYKRLSCSASQARVSTISLCNVQILNKLKNRLNNGRNLTKKLSPSKFNAYFGLYGSGTRVVSEPKFVVVKDFKNKVKFMCNYVCETDWHKDDDIKVCTSDEITMNRTDGMGLITPKQSKKWARELKLDYTPSQWCIRQSFLKGMLCTFPIHEFCEEINDGNYLVETTYKDKKGNSIVADLRDYDVIITESQFKLWDSYKSIDEYIENCCKNKLYWGVSQYSPKNDKNILTLNYQFLQTLDLNPDTIKILCSQFIDWIKGVSFDNWYYMILFLIGKNITKEKIKNFLKNSGFHWARALLINPVLKQDRYIKKTDKRVGSKKI